MCYLLRTVQVAVEDKAVTRLQGFIHQGTELKLANGCTVVDRFALCNTVLMPPANLTYQVTSKGASISKSRECTPIPAVC